MEYYVINESGRKAIRTLLLEKKDDEARVLGFIERAGSATVEQLSSSLNMPNNHVINTLHHLLSNRWIWKNSTRTAPF